jgi:hypothetical protein
MLETLNHHREGAISLSHRAPAGRQQRHMLSPPATSLRDGFADAREHEALGLEPTERDVHGADRQGAPGPALDLTANRGAVGAGAQAQERQQHELLEVAEHGVGFGTAHMYDIVKYIRRDVHAKGW